MINELEFLKILNKKLILMEKYIVKTSFTKISALEKWVQTKSSMADYNLDVKVQYSLGEGQAEQRVIIRRTKP